MRTVSVFTQHCLLHEHIVILLFRSHTGGSQRQHTLEILFLPPTSPLLQHKMFLSICMMISSNMGGVMNPSGAYLHIQMMCAAFPPLPKRKCTRVLCTAAWLSPLCGLCCEHVTFTRPRAPNFPEQVNYSRAGPKSSRAHHTGGHQTRPRAQKRGLRSVMPGSREPSGPIRPHGEIRHARLRRFFFICSQACI